MAKMVHAALSVFNIRRSDRSYRWYLYHHI
jgi:hypothetical protein